MEPYLEVDFAYNKWPNRSVVIGWHGPTPKKHDMALTRNTKRMLGPV